MTYQLVIERAKPDRIFRYDVELTRDGAKVAGTYTSSRWGARWWARSVIRKDKRRAVRGSERITREIPS